MSTVHRRPTVTAALAPIALIASASLLALAAPRATADQGDADRTAACAALPSYSDLKSALTAARQQMNGGFNLDMWATVVNRDGVVCAVAFTGGNRGDQ